MNKKKILVSILFLSITFQANSQKISFSFGPSMHGSGDLKGYVLSTGYIHQFKKRLEVELNVTNTSHDRILSSTLSDTKGKESTFEYRVLNTGTQLDLLLRVPIIDRKYKLVLAGGGFGRFQKSTMPSNLYVSKYNPLDLLNVEINYDGRPFKLYTYGFALEVENSVSLNNSIDIGIKAGIQKDATGGVILKAPFLLRYNFAY